MIFGTFWLIGIFTTDGILAADGDATKDPPTNWSNIALLVGMAVAVTTAGIALYRASAQRGLDHGTKQKIDEEVKRLQTAHDERRTKRVLRLERYVDDNVDYQRRQTSYFNELTARIDELTLIVEEAIDAGFLPRHRLPPPLSRPPEPPPRPPMPDPADAD